MTSVEIVTIGDELLLGFTIDTNAAHLARELAPLGVEIVRRTTVGDTAAGIADAVNLALARTGAVITTGGLGPTSDDLTKPAIAALFGREMILDEDVLRRIERIFRSRGHAGPVPASNRAQAMIPAGARVLENRHGSAPGIWLEDDAGRWVVMLPGVPREMRGMLADTVIPLLAPRVGDGGSVIRSRTLRTTGIAESALADQIGDIAATLSDLTLAYLPGGEGVDLRLTARRLAPAAADELLAAAAERLRMRIGSALYGEESADLAAVVIDLCRAHRATIAVGESCTGGLVGARLTAVPGSSAVFRGGVVAYADAVKTALLDVPAGEIAAHGAVSEPVARSMAAGARRRLGAEIGIGVTGIAGPGGGSEEKPVGTVWVAVDMVGSVTALVRRYPGDRDEIRRRAAQTALDMVRLALLPAGGRTRA
jgi:nicotinamide-nucleotide amidase